MNKYVITRDQDGDLKLHVCDDKFPLRSENLNSWIGNFIRLDNELFPDLKWENDPIEVTLNIEIHDTGTKTISSEEVQTEQSQQVSEIHDGMDCESDL